MSTTTDLLRPFLSRDDERFTKPYRHGGYLWATNRHVAVRVPDESSVDAESGIANVGALVTLCKNADSRLLDMRPLAVDMPTPSACRGACHGTGKVPAEIKHTCPDCDGIGTFIHGYHEWDCKECDGTGEQVGLHASDTMPCPQCDGSGHDSYQVVAIGAQTLARRYLALLLPLPGIRIWTDDTNARPAYFSWDGGVGALMPCVDRP